MKIICRFTLFSILALPIASGAHHSIAGNYDPGTIVEVEGEVTDVLWRNPHVQVSMRVIADPETFVEPMTLSKHWSWFPDAEVGIYDCSRAAED